MRKESYARNCECTVYELMIHITSEGWNGSGKLKTNSCNAYWRFQPCIRFERQLYQKAQSDSRAHKIYGKTTTIKNRYISQVFSVSQKSKLRREEL
jgi:hypothetical protein